MDIGVIYDPACPWCFIGKRRLEKALALRGMVPASAAERARPPGRRRDPDRRPVEIRWLPFLLNPELPPEGIDRTAYLIKKFGSEQRVRRVFGAIGEAGLSVEINFAFDRIARTPNTVDAHRMVRFAATRDLAPVAVEALFTAYFLKGQDIGDPAVLMRIGTDLGLPYEELHAYLESDVDVAGIYEQNAAAHRLGINGVPSYLFNGHMVISGAQEPKILARVLDVAGIEDPAPTLATA
ncbi:MAG: DsbA family oxidoreductase [Hyphomicrobiales bacterium]|nr:DsbA family oxidoreductase [Hyphomicrobiales bacterium]MCP5374025.1 DsbA family oxidoreductase [Hyphomicrobiales bacterium]